MAEKDAQIGRATESPASPSLPQRIVEWFWRASALAHARTAAIAPSARAELFVARSRVSLDVATVTLMSGPLEPSHEAIASELYRQAAYWAACALHEPGTDAAGRVDPASAWQSLEPPYFAPVEEGVETAEAMRDLLRDGSFTHFAELSLDEQSRARTSLRALAQALLSRFEERTRTARAVRAERTWRLVLFGLIAIGIGLGTAWVRDARRARSELAAGKQWRISSNYGVGGCSSPEQECPENTGYFFHTRVGDHNPSIEFDLAALQQVSTVEVENRQDCCFERAVPLTIEVSRDHKNWQAVARRDAVFSSWRASFDTVSARWVRLRVLKHSALHLRRVRIYP